jgi:hypothetical protein
MVDPFIIIKESERGQGLGEFATRKAIEFSQKLGYVGMYVDTFSNNTGRSLIFSPLAGWNIFLGLFQATSS